MAEFDGVRAKLYIEALKDYPFARKSDIDLMLKYLDPKPDETILEIGAGNGLFSGHLADSLLPNGSLYVSDPSKEQLSGVTELNRKNIVIKNNGADNLELPDNMFDAIWSFGAMHHCFAKQKSFQNFNKILKTGGRIVIGDVFVGTNLAKHFDDKVAKFCATGHEVAFWSKEYAESLCFLNGFEKPTFIDFDANWAFENRVDVGDFLYKLHAMTKTTVDDCQRGAEEILGIKEKDGKYYLGWPMTFIVTRKK